MPMAQAAWTTTTAIPESFRPERSVTFTYMAQSSSATDLPLQWRITLRTCQDTNENGWCDATDDSFVDHGERTLNVFAGQSGSVSWPVELPKPEGTYRYHFVTVCASTPCTTQSAGGAHNRTGLFTLQYTDTWQREVITTNPTSEGATQTVTYRLTSTSVDDRDLDGIVELFSKPPEDTETSQGPRFFSAVADGVTTVMWDAVSFPFAGAHELRVTDTSGQEVSAWVVVQGVRLHVHQPRIEYVAGDRHSLYFRLEGHDGAPEPHPLAGVDIHLTVMNDTYAVHQETVRTDAFGQAYATVASASDHLHLTWHATAIGTWMGTSYSVREEGEVLFTVAGAHLQENVTSIRESLDKIQLEGVHLDELGSRHLFLTSVRAAGTVLLVVLLILFVIYVAIRV